MSISLTTSGQGGVVPRGQGEVIDGRYELVGPIGCGGMGTVYRAIQRPIDREVAVKVLRRSHADQDDKAVKRFFKEARAIASLHHPHIIPLYDFGEARTGDLFLVMELLPGRSLAQIMHDEGAVALPRAAAILDQVLDALQEAHMHNIVHRDLKPENIQIGRRGDQLEFVTVLDFGIARTAEVPGAKVSTTTIEVAGTPAYMSPEQILGSTVDPRTDLYALGVLLFELITGRLPFDSERTIDIYMMHLKDTAPRLRDVMSSSRIPDGLQELVDRAMAKAPEDRIPDAGAFRRALRAVAGLRPRSTGRNGRGGSASSNPKLGNAHGFELVAAIEPARSPGVAELLQQWTVDIPQHGGMIRERRPGLIVANFPGLDDPSAAMRAALAMKKRTRAQRLSMLRPLYIRVGIHSEPQLASRLCEEAPRGGVVIGADCVQSLPRKIRDSGFRLEPAGDLRVRGHRGPLRMLQLISGR